ncbi:hypothetical protein [Candidatus Cyanaurora vandensis]|uniref:hypothetical protein n=2 Tax=Candidatus Cyanaurora vandensis TaxID=2714958 RepID=UPI00257E6F01|nr:hypothetical protein [Candidatus Cyanaurora vandensis]
MSAHLYSRRQALTALGVTGFLTLPAHAETFVVDDQIITDPRIAVQDVEFDFIEGRIAWQDKQGQLWVAKVDPVTGAFMPSTGQGRLIDTGLAGISDSGNGPEWAYGIDGPEIVYTKYTDSSRSAFVLAHARNINGNWYTEVLPNLPLDQGGYSPIGSQDLNDPDPRVKYQLGGPETGSQGLAYRSLISPSWGIVPDPTADAGRWVEKRRSLIVTILVNGVRQVAYHEIDTGVLTQLTSDPGQKNNVFMWEAPEFNHELIFMASVNAETIDMYRFLNGAWTRFNSLKPPSPRPYLLSPEPLVYGGKSYVFALASNGFKTSQREPSDVWLMAVDPANPLYRQVSNPDLVLVRADPEYFTTTLGPWIYYSQRQGSRRLTHRCSTGLGPGQ